MPDGVTTPEVKIKIQQAATHTETANEYDKSKTPEEQRIEQEWREERAKGTEGTAVLEQIRNSATEARFTSQEAEDLKSQFGGGNAEIDPSGNPPKAELKGNPTPLERQSFEAAGKRIDEINDFIRYTDVLVEAQKTGKKPSEVITARRNRGETALITENMYSTARTKALAAILEDPATKVLYPGLSKVSSQDEKMTYIETMLASDPKFRSKIVKEMREIVEESQNLPDVARDNELRTAEAEQKTLQTTLKTKLEQMFVSIQADGITLNDTEEQEIINLASSGATPDQIVSRLRNKALESVPGYDKFANLADLESMHNQLRDRLRDLEKQLPSTETSKSTTNPNLVEAIKIAREESERVANNYYAAKNFMADNKANYERYLELNSKYSMSTTDTSPIGSRFREIADASGKLSEITALIAERKANPNRSERASILTRQNAEARLQERLDGIFTKGITETIEERYDEIVGLEQKRLQQEAEKTGKADNIAVAKGLGSDFIEFDPRSRQKIVHQENINEAIRLLAYEGQEGIDRLLIKHLGFKTPLLDADDEPQADGPGNPIMVDIDWRTVDLSTLSGEQKARLEAVRKEYGDKYRDRVFKDAFAARTLGSKLRDALPGTHEMGLKKHEWGMLEANFSGKLEEALRGSREASDAIKKLEAQGIKPDFKMKWLLWAALLVGIGIFAVPAIGGIGAATQAAATVPSG